MATSFNVFQPIAQFILDQTASWGEIPNTIISWVLPPIAVALSINIIWHGFSVMRGAGGRDHLLDVFFNSLRTFFVVSLGLIGGMYATNVIGLLQELRTQLTDLFSSSGISSYQALDLSIGKAIDAYKTIWNWGVDHISFWDNDYTGVLAIIGGGVMVMCMLIYSLVAVANLLIIDFSIAFLLSVGPMFIALLAFNATSSFFNTWMSAVLKYTLSAVVIAAIVGLGNSMLSSYSNKLAADPATMDYIAATFGALGGVGVLIALALRAGALAADLVGGIGVSLMSGISLGKQVLTGAASAGSKLPGAAKAAAGMANDVGRGSSLRQKAMEHTASMRSARGLGKGSITGG